ncbi:MAG: glycosyltransferase family 4 protein [Gemmataceae bacterium]
MRIAITNWSRRVVGGTEGYIQAVIAALAARGLEVALWTEQDEPTDREAMEVPVGISSWCVADCGPQAALDELRAWRPDLVFGHGLRDDAGERAILDLAPAVFFAHSYHGICISGTKTFTLPTIEACHRPFGGGCLLCYYPRRCGGLNPLVGLSLYRTQSRTFATLRRYARIITHSNYVADEYRRNGFAAGVVTYVVDAAAPGELTAPTSTSESGEIRLNDLSRRTLVFVGRMDRLKGGEVLLNALPEVARELKGPLRLIMAGDGPERQRWERQAESVCRKNPQIEIKFPGWTDPANLDRLLAKADLAVVPSLWPEPFGKVGPEAGLCGLPVVAFDVGGVGEWLHDGVNGHLAAGHPPTAAGLAAAIVKCLGDPAHHAQLRANAKSIAARFQMQTHVQELLGVFDEVLAGTPNGCG